MHDPGDLEIVCLKPGVTQDFGVIGCYGNKQRYMFSLWQACVCFRYISRLSWDIVSAPMGQGATYTLVIPVLESQAEGLGHSLKSS